MSPRPIRRVEAGSIELAPSAPVPEPLGPLRNWPAAGPTPRTVSLLTTACQLLGIYERVDLPVRKILLSSMFDMVHEIRAYALEMGGYGKNRGDSKDVYRAQLIFITGRDPDHTARCEALTKDHRPCGNRPMVGEKHCHIPTHSTEEERKRSSDARGRWAEHLTMLLDAADLREVHNQLWEYINQAKDL